jgi:hypothetical protein
MLSLYTISYSSVTDGCLGAPLSLLKMNRARLKMNHAGEESTGGDTTRFILHKRCFVLPQNVLWMTPCVSES